MTAHPDPEQILDQGIEQIRRDALDDAVAAAAADRVWSRLGRGGVSGREPLRGCADIRGLIPDLLAGALSPARAALVEDHLGECLPCRRVAMAARHGEQAAASQSRRIGWRLPRAAQLAAAALATLAFSAAALWTGANLLAERRLTAALEGVHGSLALEDGDQLRALAVGAVVRAGQPLRTGAGSGALLRLGDGSLVEVGPRSRLSLHRSLTGTTVLLTQGNIIVEAADQGLGRLYVTTNDCVVAVRGTIFAVGHGLKGSRVAVIEGEVEVRRPGDRRLVASGEQMTTNQQLRAVAITEQIAWSRHADRHRAVLGQLTRLHHEVAAAVEPKTARTSTALLDLAPPDTLVYLALPNLANGLAEARAIIDQRLASSAELREWWQANLVATGIEGALEELLDRLQPIGEAVGAEVVAAVPASAVNGTAGPLVLALLDDPAAFRALLADEVARINARSSRPVLEVVADPLALTDSSAQVILWIEGDLFAAAHQLALLQELARRRVDPASPSFVGSELHGRLAERYRDGVSWLAGLDLSALAARSAASDRPGQRELADRLGLLDVATLVVEGHRAGDDRVLTAELRFDRPRRGVAAWLAEPSPMASLELFSRDASLVTAILAKDAAAVFDELMDALASVAPEALAELERETADVGFDLRSDLAATLGGEAALGLDGPLLPTPAWKLVVEVSDPGTLQATIERAVAELDRRLEEAGRPGLEMRQSTVGGRTCHTIEHPESGGRVSYLVAGGYLIAAPEPALLEQALQYRASGAHLATAAAFRELLPANGYADCSALLWRNLAPLAGALPEAARSGLDPATLGSLARPSLYCAYGAPDRILVSGTGSGMVGALPWLGLAGGAAGLASPAGGPKPVSSPG